MGNGGLIGTEHGEAHRPLCLNCGTRLIGAHCHACGQAGHVHRSVGAIGHEIAHGVFHFEGKIWRTLPLLVLRPGELTRRYIAGERMRFVSPLALFLFTVFLMFAAFSLTGADLVANVEQQAGRVDAGLTTGRARTEAALADLRARRAAAVAAGRATKPMDADIAAAEADLRALDALRTRDASPTEAEISTVPPWLTAAIAKARANPGLIAYKVQSSAYKFSWALILLSIPFVALLFLWRRGYGLYDHAIFVTYSIAFMSLLVIALELLVALSVGSGLLWAAALLIPPVHMFAQLKGAYRLSFFSALWRTMFLATFSVTVLLLFVLGLVAMGVAA